MQRAWLLYIVGSFLGEVEGGYRQRCPGQSVLPAAGVQDRFGEHFVLDLYAAYRVNKHVEVFLLGENLTDRQYLGTFFGGGQLAAPLQIFGGVRLAAF